MLEYASVMWLVATIVFCIIEAATVQMISIWFAAGSLMALVASMFDLPLWLQFGIFFMGTAVVLTVTRPLAKRLVNAKKTATNADMVLGSTGIVEQPIDNLRETGRVFVNGLSWAARSEDGNPIPAEEKVLVKRIEGAKIYVEAEAR